MENENNGDESIKKLGNFDILIPKAKGDENQDNQLTDIEKMVVKNNNLLYKNNYKKKIIILLIIIIITLLLLVIGLIIFIHFKYSKKDDESYNTEITKKKTV